MSSNYVMGKGEAIRAGKAGHSVQVTLAGAPAPLPNTARLLGSSSAFVFLWWPHARLAEAVPIESEIRGAVGSEAGCNRTQGECGKPRHALNRIETLRLEHKSPKLERDLHARGCILKLLTTMQDARN